MAENWGQTPINVRDIGGQGPVPVGGEVSHNVAAAAETIEIVKSAGASYLVLRGEAGTHRVRAGKLDQQTFADGDVTVGTDTINIDDHGYVSGDGPLFLSNTPAAMAGDPDLTFADADPDTITRDAGSWVDDGFVAGMEITVDSADNDGTFTLAIVAALVLTLVGSDELVAEGPTAGHTVTGGALPDGLAVDVPFWVIKVDDDNFQLAVDHGDAVRPDLASALDGGSDPIPVDITAAVNAGTHEIGGFQGIGVTVGFTPALTGVTPTADLVDGGSVPLLTNEIVQFTGTAITVRATAAGDKLTWWEI